MKKFLKPTIFKIIFSLALIAVWLLGPILYGRIAANSGVDPENPNLLMTALNNLNYISGLIFYPSKFISNIFVPQNYILDSLSNGTHGYILLLSSMIYLILIVIESYLISCVISWVALFFIKKAR